MVVGFDKEGSGRAGGIRLSPAFLCRDPDSQHGSEFPKRIGPQHRPCPLPVKVQKQKKARIEDSKKYNKTNKKGSSLRREVRDCGFLGYGLNTVGHRGLFL